MKATLRLICNNHLYMTLYDSSDVGNRTDGASPCKALIPTCNIISKGKFCSSDSKSVLYLPNIYVAVARVAEVSYLLLLVQKLQKKNNNPPSMDNVITRICNVVLAILPSNLFSLIDSHILDFENFSENHNFIFNQTNNF
jgi:hypothetical protein